MPRFSKFTSYFRVKVRLDGVQYKTTFPKVLAEQDKVEGSFRYDKEKKELIFDLRELNDQSDV